MVGAVSPQYPGPDFTVFRLNASNLTLETKGLLTFANEVGEWSAPGWPGPSGSLFLSPRHDRQYGPLLYDFGSNFWWSPEFAAYAKGKDGADLHWIGRRKPTERAIAILQTFSITGRPGSQILPLGPPAGGCWYPEPDSLGQFLDNIATPGWWTANRASVLDPLTSTLNPLSLRPPLLKEDFNALANRVNRLTRCRPLCIEDVWTVFTPDGDGGGLGSCDGDGSSNCGIRPINQFRCVFGTDAAALTALCSLLAIPIKTKSDLPASWGGIVSAIAAGQFLLMGQYSAATFSVVDGGAANFTWTDNSGPPPLTYHNWYRAYTVTQTAAPYHLGDTVAGSPAADWIDLNCYNITAHNWLRDEDVQTAATGLGLSFSRQSVGRAVTPTIVETTDPGPMSYDATIQNCTFYIYKISQADIDGTGDHTGQNAANAFTPPDFYSAATGIAYYRYRVRLLEPATAAAADFIAPLTLGSAGTRLSADATQTVAEPGLNYDLVPETVSWGPNYNTTNTLSHAITLADTNDYYYSTIYDPSGHALVNAASSVTSIVDDGKAASLRARDYAEVLSVLYVSLVSSPCQDASHAIRTPWWTFTRTPGWSGLSADNAAATLAHGDTARPAAFHAPSGAADIIALVTGRQFITPPTGQRASLIAILPDVHVAL